MNIEIPSFDIGRRARRVLLVAAIVVALIVPVVSPSNVSIATEALIVALFALSVDLALGYTGLLTLAPAAFFGLGAYTLAKLVVDFEQSFWLGFPAAVVVAALAAFVVGYVPIKRRIGNVYFALFTLAFGTVAYDFTYVTTEITGGSNGLGFFVPPALFGVNLATPMNYYYFALVVVGVLSIGTYLLLRTDYGDILHATRQNEQRMRYLGYDTDRERMIAWTFSAALSALSGALYVGMVGIASPSYLSFDRTGEVIIWVIVGGTGTLTGPFSAAILLTFVQDALSNVWLEGYHLLLGVLFVLFVFLLPDGIVGALLGDED